MQNTNPVSQSTFDPAIMYEASDVLAGYGLTVTDAFRIMLQDIVNGKWLPVDTDGRQEIPNAETQKAMEMADRDEDILYAKDAQEFFKQLGI